MKTIIERNYPGCCETLVCSILDGIKGADMVDGSYDLHLSAEEVKEICKDLQHISNIEVS